MVALNENVAPAVHAMSTRPRDVKVDADKVVTSPAPLSGAMRRSDPSGESSRTPRTYECSHSSATLHSRGAGVSDSLVDLCLGGVRIKNRVYQRVF